MTNFLVTPFQDELAGFLWCVYVGVLLATLYLVTNKHVSGQLLRLLAENGCVSEETAKTLASLGLKPRFPLRFALRKGAPLSRLVASASEAEKQELSDARFWVPEEKKEKAAYLARGVKLSWPSVLAAVFGLYLALCICYQIIPLFIK